MILVENLCFEYSDRPVLHQINLHGCAGEVIYLRGDNGSGKTTLLKLMAGLLTPTSGTITMQGSLLYIGHSLGIHLALTVRENFQFFPDQETKSQSFTYAMNCQQILDNLNLLPFLDTACYRLSAGQQRRVSLARLWHAHAAVWLLDEPFTALDHATVQRVLQRMQAHVMNGGLVVLTSHQPLMMDGKIKEYYLS